jgi:hypothetical protein
VEDLELHFHQEWKEQVEPKLLCDYYDLHKTLFPYHLFFLPSLGAEGLRKSSSLFVQRQEKQGCIRRSRGVSIFLQVAKKGWQEDSTH